jgi:uncharacterized membrane protein
MIRTLLWLLGGVVLGGIIHIAVILILPLVSPNPVWREIVALDALNKPVVLPAVTAGTPNPLRLDPELTYAVCRIDLRNGPGIIRGTLPQAFWSVAFFDPQGAVIYSSTNRDGIGQTLEVGVFNQAQTRLLAEQTLNVAESLLIVEARSDDIFALIRLAPPHQAMRARYEQLLQQVSCGNLAVPAE